ncbi:MAG: SGNH/GDSL hydrolase family protein, partial [Clostridia bacterium]|nr:SGNH/GDSL hydrolase family protein [Clostridia bacterium]
MKHTKNRLLALLLVLAMVIGMVPMLALAVGAEGSTAATIEVGEDGAITNLTWTNAYVGSSYHNWHAWKVVETAWSDGYRLSNILTVPKAGTTLVWTETAANGVMSQNAFFLTSWKEVDGTWTIDLSGANLIADPKITIDGHDTDTQFYDQGAKTVTYTYTTVRDNESLRFGCYGKGLAADACPTVYAYTPVFADGAVSGLKWFSGYVGSSTNSNGYPNVIKYVDSVYSYSAPLIVPKAGTTISFTDDDGKCCSSAAYAFSVWTFGGDNRLNLFYGMPGNNTANAANEAWIDVTDAGYVYSYTTASDNEVIRLCYRDDNQPDLAVSYVEDNAEVLPSVLEAAGFDAEQSGTPYINATWKPGSVGVLSNTFVIGADDYGYRVTDIIPVLGKGTTVTVTDVIGAGAVEAGADNFIGSERYAISSFLRGDYTSTAISNDVKTVNSALANVKGLDDYTVAVENGKCTYTYTTTEDVEFIRVSIRDVGNFSAEGEASKTCFIAPIIYISAPESDVYHEELEGARIYAIGDSYLEGNGINYNDNWLSMLAARYDAHLVSHGRNGSSISAYASKNNPMVNRYQNLPNDPDADIIIFEGGRNDYNQNVPIGTVGDEDPNTFAGAVLTTLDGLLQKYPEAVILCMTPWNLDGMTTGANQLNKVGNRTRDYTDAFKQVVEYMDNDRVRLIRNDDTSVIPVHMTGYYFRKDFCMNGGDISHLNGYGMKTIMPYLENEIAALYADYLADKAGATVSFAYGDVTYSFTATDADVEVTVPNAPLAVDEYVLGWAGTLNGEKVAQHSGAALSLKAGDVGYFEPIIMELQQAGAPGVRFEEGSTGLRFLTSVSLSKYNYGADLLEGTGVEIDFGTLIVPYQYVVEMGGTLTHASLAEADMLHLDIPCNISGGTDWYKRDDANDAGYIAGSIASIKTKNYARAFTAAGYAKIEYADGTVSYVYAKNGGRTASAVYDVAYKAINDRADAYSGVYQYR